VLSVGSGHGLLERYLAELNGDVVVEGFEIDEQRVGVAAATEGRAPRVALRAADIRTLDRGEAFDAALAVDLFHHLEPNEQAQLLDVLARRVNSGGALLVKDIALTPRWRWTVNRVHDRLVAGPAPIYCREPEEMAAAVARAGFEVEAVERLRSFTPYPHYLVRGRR
jgi:cyclopropane fatty-acyl-phospholipid synthase-like methyltransferase